MMCYSDLGCIVACSASFKNASLKFQAQPLLQFYRFPGYGDDPFCCSILQCGFLCRQVTSVGRQEPDNLWMALPHALQEPRSALCGHAAGCHNNSYLTFVFLKLIQPAQAG